MRSLYSTGRDKRPTYQWFCIIQCAQDKNSAVHRVLRKINQTEMQRSLKNRVPVFNQSNRRHQEALTIHVLNQLACGSIRATRWRGSIRPAPASGRIEPKAKSRIVSLMICSTWLKRTRHERRLFLLRITFPNSVSSTWLFLTETPRPAESRSMEKQWYIVKNENAHRRTFTCFSFISIIGFCISSEIAVGCSAGTCVEENHCTKCSTRIERKVTISSPVELSRVFPH